MAVKQRREGMIRNGRRGRERGKERGMRGRGAGVQGAEGRGEGGLGLGMKGIEREGAREVKRGCRWGRTALKERNDAEPCLKPLLHLTTEFIF